MGRDYLRAEAGPTLTILPPICRIAGPHTRSLAHSNSVTAILPALVKLMPG